MKAMSMSNSNDDSELEYYVRIVDYFQNHKDLADRETLELWKYKSLIELMKVLKRTHNKDFVRNALILIMSLTEHVPPDVFENLGINANSLKNDEKDSLVSILKAEFDVPN